MADVVPVAWWSAEDGAPPLALDRVCAFVGRPTVAKILAPGLALLSLVASDSSSAEQQHRRYDVLVGSLTHSPPALSPAVGDGQSDDDASGGGGEDGDGDGASSQCWEEGPREDDDDVDVDAGWAAATRSVAAVVAVADQQRRGKRKTNDPPALSYSREATPERAMRRRPANPHDDQHPGTACLNTAMQQHITSETRRQRRHDVPRRRPSSRVSRMARCASRSSSRACAFSMISSMRACCCQRRRDVAQTDEIGARSHAPSKRSTTRQPMTAELEDCGTPTWFHNTTAPPRHPSPHINQDGHPIKERVRALFRKGMHVQQHNRHFSTRPRRQARHTYPPRAPCAVRSMDAGTQH